LAHRRRRVEELERRIRGSRDRTASTAGSDLTVKFVIGGIREVTAARLRRGRAEDLPGLADQLTEWAARYPREPPKGLAGSPRARRRRSGKGGTSLASERALRAQGRLPSGRSD